MKYPVRLFALNKSPVTIFSVIANLDVRRIREHVVDTVPSCNKIKKPGLRVALIRDAYNKSCPAKTERFSSFLVRFSLSNKDDEIQKVLWNSHIIIIWAQSHCFSTPKRVSRNIASRPLVVNIYVVSDL